MSAFLRVELTHAPAVSNLYRAILPTQGGTGFRWHGSIRHRSPGEGGETFQGGSGRERLRCVVAEVFTVFFLNRVLQRLVEQIIESSVVHEQEIFKVFSQDRVNWDQRFVEHNLETPRVLLEEV